MQGSFTQEIAWFVALFGGLWAMQAGLRYLASSLNRESARD